MAAHKIYMYHDFNRQLLIEQNSEMYTPVKGVKGMPDVIKKRLKVADDLFSTAVSRIRQPVEAIFNWQKMVKFEKTNEN